jgi:hypothetical protein
VDVPAPLERKVGPFPLVAWAGLIGGGAALGLVLRKRMGGKPKPTDDNTLPDISDAEGSPTSAVASGTAARGVVTVPAPSAGAPVAEPGVTTNQAWGTKAVRYLIDTGTDAALAQQAIGKFLDGTGLTASEQALVSKALTGIGPTPEYAPPITRAPAEAPAAPPGFTAEQPAPAPAAAVTPPGALVSHDGDTVFWTDGTHVEHVKDGNRSIALWRNGAQVRGFAGALDPNAPGAYPVPLYMAEAAIRSLQHVGTPPPSWGTW